MSDINETIDNYFEFLSETDAAKRLQLVAKVWTSDGQWIDPPLDAEGHEGLAAMVGTIFEHYPGHAFRRTSAIDAHHDVVRFTWDLVAPDGTVAFSGLDVGQVAGDGRLRRVNGFIGDLAAA
jgi:hypothetical protein